VSNSTPIDPHSGEEQAEPAVSEEQKAAEERLSELKHEVQRMLDAGRLMRDELPGWELECELEWITEEQADRLYQGWLSLQIRRHAECPDIYGKVPGHNGNRIMHMLAYCAEKKVRLREIQDEVRQIGERNPSPRVAEEADGIAGVCELLEEIYGDKGVGPSYAPRKKTGLT
jgi:hypothetical protein